MVRTLEQTNRLLQAARECVVELQAERDALVRAAHVVTAADFRITIEQDDCSYSFEDIVGDGAEDAEMQDPDSFYYRAKEAYHGRSGDGVYAWGVILERRDPATGVFEQDESCWGFFSLSNWPDADTMSGMMEYVAGWLPKGINIKDVEGAQ